MSQTQYIPKPNLQKLFTILQKNLSQDKVKYNFIIEITFRKPAVELFSLNDNGTEFKILEALVRGKYDTIKEDLKNPTIQSFFQRLKVYVDRINHSTCFRLSKSSSGQWYFNIMIFERYSLLKFLKEKEKVLSDFGYTVQEAYEILVRHMVSETEEGRKLLRILNLSKKKLRKLLLRKYKKRKWIFCKVLGIEFNGKLKIRFLVLRRYIVPVLKVLKAYYYETGIDKSWLVRHDKLGLVITRIIPIQN